MIQYSQTNVLWACSVSDFTGPYAVRLQAFVPRTDVHEYHSAYDGVGLSCSW